MSVIDPVEACLAVIGVRPIISKAVEKVRMPQVREMVELPKTIAKRAMEVLKGDVAKLAPHHINYMKFLDELTKDFNIKQLEEMIAAFPMELHAISSLFLVEAKKIIELLQRIVPIQTKETLLGVENLLPPALAVRRFVTSLEILDNPLRVFDYISCGSLLKSQVEIVKEVYPTLSECIEESLDEAAIHLRAQNKSYKLPTRVEIGTNVWKGLPTISVKMQAKLQANFAKADKEQPKPSGESGSSTSVVAKEALTNTQRTMFPQSSKG